MLLNNVCLRNPFGTIRDDDGEMADEEEEIDLAGDYHGGGGLFGDYGEDYYSSSGKVCSLLTMGRTTYDLQGVRELWGGLPLIRYSVLLLTNMRWTTHQVLNASCSGSNGRITVH